MSEILERRTLKAGDTIFREGESGSSAYIVQSGEVAISKLIGGADTQLAVIGKGGVFGEMSLIDDKPRMATARAKEASVIVTVTKAIFDQKLKGTDPFVRALLRILVETVRNTSK